MYKRFDQNFNILPLFPLYVSPTKVKGKTLLNPGTNQQNLNPIYRQKLLISAKLTTVMISINDGCTEVLTLPRMAAARGGWGEGVG